MFADAEILISQRKALAVPISAVGARGQNAAVMVVSDGKVSQRLVETGIRDNGWIEIRSGLQAGETVVTKAGAFVQDGDMVHPVPAADSATGSNGPNRAINPPVAAVSNLPGPVTAEPAAPFLLAPGSALAAPPPAQLN